MKILNCFESILAIFTFGFLLISKITQFILSNKLDKTILRNKIKGDNYAYELNLLDGNDNLVLFNPEENIFNVSFYEIFYDYKTDSFQRRKKLNTIDIDKLIAGEKILIHTIVPDGIPNIEVTWENICKSKISAIIYYNGKNGGNLSIIKYQRNWKSFLYYFFKN